MKVRNRVAAALAAAAILLGAGIGPASAVSWYGWTAGSGYWDHGTSGSQYHAQERQASGTYRAWTSMLNFQVSIQARYTSGGQTITVGPYSGNGIASTTQDRISTHNPGW